MVLPVLILKHKRWESCAEANQFLTYLIHWGMGRFCFCFLASLRLMRKVLRADIIFWKENWQIKMYFIVQCSNKSKKQGHARSQNCYNHLHCTLFMFYTNSAIRVLSISQSPSNFSIFTEFHWISAARVELTCFVPNKTPRVAALRDRALSHVVFTFIFITNQFLIYGHGQYLEIGLDAFKYLFQQW